MWKFVEGVAKCKVESINLDRPVLRAKKESDIVRKLLSSHGTVETFDLLELSRESFKEKALVRFSDPKYAGAAEKHFSSRKRVHELSGGRLFVQRIFTHKVSLPSHIFQCLLPNIMKLLAANQTVRHSVFESAAWKVLSVTTDTELLLADIKQKLSVLLTSTTVKDGQGRPIWTRSTMSPAFKVAISKMPGNLLNCLWFDSRRQVIRVFGESKAKRKEIAGIVAQVCSTVDEEMIAVPVTRELWNAVMNVKPPG